MVHQIRNACKYIVWKDKKQLTQDIKLIYTAPNKQMAEAELELFEQKWGGKYQYAVKAGGPLVLSL